MRKMFFTSLSRSFIFRIGSALLMLVADPRSCTAAQPSGNTNHELRNVAGFVLYRYRGQHAFHSSSKQVQRRRLAGEQLKLESRLPHEHLDAGDDMALAQPGLLDKQCLFRRVHAFHYDEARLEEATVDWAIIKVWVHAD